MITEKTKKKKNSKIKQYFSGGLQIMNKMASL